MGKTSRSATRSRLPRQTALTAARPRTPQTTARPEPHVEAARLDGAAQQDGSLAALLERASHQVLAITHWFEPVQRTEPYSVTVRFSGRRVGVTGPAQLGDEFLHEETINEVVPGSGPIALTARVRDINPGEWTVKATTVEYTHSRRGRQEPEHARPVERPVNPLTRLWFKWAPPVDTAIPVKTGQEAYIRIPGVIPLIWVALVTIGMVVAVLVQALLAARLHLAVGAIFISTALAIGVGIAGAKIWYIIKHRDKHDIIGWCIQGFIAGATITAVIMFTVVRVPLGTVLDVTAPGLMLGLAVGRVGCFFAGCCGGPPTASRWGVWCSDQHVGARRIPTQLMESLFSLILGLITLAAVLMHGPAGGVYFVAVIAAYTLFREGILRLRAEPLTTRLPVLVTPVLSALVLVAALVVLVRQ
jgi:phosphatidylglycerol:prolipoprotein diacylglycerol transferase